MPGNLPAATSGPHVTTRRLRTAAAASAVISLAACSVLRPTPARQPAAAAAQRASTDIYRLLPFTPPQLTAAAALASRFTSLYGTYSYNQPSAAYLTRLAPMTTANLQTALTQGFTTPGLIQQRTTEKESAVSTAAVTAIRDIGGTSITFLVTGRQGITTSGATSQVTTSYAVTVTSTAGIWKVYSIELATDGQAGSMP